MTEAEAKTKWCPQTFGIPDVRDHEGNGIMQGGPFNCRGSECMAWRWSKKPMGQEQDHEDIARDLVAMHPDRFSFDQMTSPIGILTDHVGTGYCGLAGRP